MSKEGFEVSRDYIALCAATWDFELMRMARYVDRSEVNLRPYSLEGLRLVRGLTALDRWFASLDQRRGARGRLGPAPPR